MHYNKHAKLTICWIMLIINLLHIPREKYIYVITVIENSECVHLLLQFKLISWDMHRDSKSETLWSALISRNIAIWGNKEMVISNWWEEQNVEAPAGVSLLVYLLTNILYRISMTTGDFILKTPKEIPMAFINITKSCSKLWRLLYRVIKYQFLWVKTNSWALYFGVVRVRGLKDWTS